MAVARAVQEYLTAHHIAYDVIEHPRALSSMRTAQAAHIPGEQLAKSVVLEDDTGYLVAVVPSTHRVDLGQLHHQLDRLMGLAVEPEVGGLFRDCELGAIPPIGAAYRIDTIVDDSLLQQSEVYFEAGDHEALVHMSGKAFGAMMAGVPHGRIARHV